MELLIGTSLITAFIAGIAALFAPCCITVLLPSYFGQIFRTRKRVFFMTFIFFLGIVTVFIPLGFGFSALGKFFSRYHEVIFTFAGIFFLLLGTSLVLGKKFSLPFSVHPTLKAENAPSVFVMGLLSGIATTCCAPVLAGVLALSVLPGSVLWGMVYTLAYVLGMVSPLFAIALVLDRSKLTERFMSSIKMIHFKILGKGFEVSLYELISGITFLIIGAMTFVWAMMNPAPAHSEIQVSINIMLTKFQQSLNGIIGNVPQLVWALAVLGLLILIVWNALRTSNNNN